jgi:hypothetical protein
MKKELSNTKQQESSPWTKRFIAAAIVQGAIIVALTAFLVYKIEKVLSLVRF